MSLDKLDYIRCTRPSGRKDKLYKCFCETCGKERGYFAKNLAKLNCNSCSMKNKMSKLSLIEKSDRAKKARSYRKNNKLSKHTKHKISTANSGKVRTLQHRINISAANQNMLVKDWKDFKYNLDDPKRCKYKSERFCIKVYKKHNYTCVLCDSRGGRLHAHHLNNWAQFKKDRYDLDNIICLCVVCHRAFHNTYGTRNNTKKQFEEYRRQYVK